MLFVQVTDRFFIKASETVAILIAVKVEFKSDSQKVLNDINFGTSYMNKVGSIVDDITRKSRGRDFVFLFIHRTSN